MGREAHQLKKLATYRGYKITVVKEGDHCETYVSDKKGYHVGGFSGRGTANQMITTAKRTIDAIHGD